MPAMMRTFGGDDVASLINRSVGNVDCGPGNDRVDARPDDVLLDCETVAYPFS